MESKFRKYFTIITLGLAGGSIYILPYIKYAFYDAQIAAMGITNTQSGLMMTMYTIGNMILYIPGGIIADKIPPKKALVVSLLSTTVLGMIYAFSMNFIVGLIVWLGLSFTTVFLFWSSLMKAVRIIGTEDEQGFMYGLYYACNGITSAMSAAISLFAYKSAGGDMVNGFFRAVVSSSIITAVAAVLLLVLMKEDKNREMADDNEAKFQVMDVFTLLKNPVVWIVSLTILCGYGLYSSTSYFNPYLTAVIGVSPEDSGMIAVVRNYLLLLLSPIGGLLADRVFKSTCKWLATAFIILAALYGIVMILPLGISPTIAALYTLLPAAVAVMMYGVIFSTVSEAGIPRVMTGTVIGLASVIGYLPDSVYAVLFGGWIDKYGTDGYGYIFTFLLVSGIVGAVLSMLIYSLNRKAKAEEAA